MITALRSCLGRELCALALSENRLLSAIIGYIAEAHGDIAPVR